MPPRKKVREGNVPDYMKELAQESRENPTEAEAALWEYLSNKQLGVVFWRQHCFNINGHDYRVDFYCKELKLAVEIDGPIHQFKNRDDAIREWHIEQLRIQMLRFSNEEVLASPARVARRIHTVIERL
ncbi:endonuclease domain-containing protein [Archangium sp.]|uniref:endonuclease domain-containing protein n=1 Tax=Archangium sp. TaxID=1872627 RepID=UPI00389A2DF1